MDFNPANIAAWDPTVDIQSRPLWPYIKNVAVYKCPADHSYITIGAVQRPRVRPISMNLYLGGFKGALAGSAYMVYLKMGDVTGGKSPGPSKLWIFLDEREDCVNWGNFGTDMAGYPGIPTSLQAAYQFVEDIPGCYHNLSAGFSFADGHSEQHRWLDGRTMPPMHYQVVWWTGLTISCPYSKDVAWLQDRSTRPKLETQLNQRKGAKVQETQRFRLLGAITRWVSDLSMHLLPHLSTPCVLATWRLCVNCPYSNEIG
jgi:prepilin-type processing-associated H-X9-DG protein